MSCSSCLVSFCCKICVPIVCILLLFELHAYTYQKKITHTHLFPLEYRRLPLMQLSTAEFQVFLPLGFQKHSGKLQVVYFFTKHWKILPAYIKLFSLLFVQVSMFRFLVIHNIINEDIINTLFHTAIKSISNKKLFSNCPTHSAQLPCNYIISNSNNHQCSI